PGVNTGSACVWTGNPNLSGWSQWCVNSTTPSNTVAYLRSANAQQTSLFADDQHFSAAGQKIEADFMYSLVVAPSEISFLAAPPRGAAQAPRRRHRPARKPDGGVNGPPRPFPRLGLRQRLLAEDAQPLCRLPR